ncbi:MAG: 4Fe-4S binding protein [Clostridiales bacterium]|nr:4Fe-4S binding protein [Clostridiales bacterium]
MSSEDNIISRRVTVRYSPGMVDQPIIYRLVKDFDLIPNILKAEINPDKEGYLLLGLSGHEDNYQRAMAYLQEQGLQVQSIVEHVRWDEENCTQCGFCAGVCPSNALYRQQPSQTVHFDCEKCIVCNMCIQACPVQAVTLDF